MSTVAFYEVTVPFAGTLPFSVTLAELKAQLKIDSSDEDTLLTSYLIAAEEKIQGYLNIIIPPQTIRGNFTYFECSRFEPYEFISFMRFPIIMVNIVEIFDGTNFVEVVLPDYIVKNRSLGYTRFLFPNGITVSFPTTVAYPIGIEAVCGYATPGDVPQLIKNAILMYAAYLNQKRGDCVDCECDSDGVPSLPGSISSTISQYKIREVYT